MGPGAVVSLNKTLLRQEEWAGLTGLRGPVKTSLLKSEIHLIMNKKKFKVKSIPSHSGNERVFFLFADFSD